MLRSSTRPVSRTYWLFSSTPETYRRQIHTKTPDEIILDRKLIESIGFPSTVDNVEPCPNFVEIKELLLLGAKMDHFVPVKNSDSETWHIVNAFGLATENQKSEEIVDIIFKNYQNWNYHHTILRHDIFNTVQIKTFVREVTGTPLGLSFAFALEKH